MHHHEPEWPMVVSPEAMLFHVYAGIVNHILDKEAFGLEGIKTTQLEVAGSTAYCR